MFSEWMPLVWLMATLPPLFLTKRWISRHVQGLGLLLTGDSQAAAALYFVLLLPGILVHELSHWLAAALLGVRTGGISIWPSRRGGRVRMGSVKVGRADPLRASLVGAAPLVGGSLVVLLIGQWILGVGELGEALLGGGWSAFLRGLLASLRLPDFWLWLYLIFAVSNAMLPSEADRKPWRPLLVFLGLVAVLFYLLGWAPRVPEAATSWFLRATGYLAYAFGLTVAVDLVFIALIAALEGAMARLTGRRVKY